jgi:hypothetical protein
MNKKCINCQEEFPIENFPPVSGGRPASRCRPCKQEYDRDYWQNNKNKLNSKKKKNRDIIKLRNTKYVLKYLLENPCTDCGEVNPLVLEFDHLDPKDKSCDVSSMLQGSSLKSIKEEISKCDVVCSNCHSIRTAKRGNWLMYRLLGVG